MGNDRRARRQQRAGKFGARHPRLSLVIIGALPAGAIAICGFQLSYGTYLGRGWWIAALAGIAAAAGMAAAAGVSGRVMAARPAAGRVVIAWLVLGVVSVSAIKYPFPRGPYGGEQAFFNVVHAALLGYAAVTCAAIDALFAYLVLRPRRPARLPAARAGLRRARPAPRPAGLQARLRFPAANAAPWRAGRLIAANGKVTWLPRNGEAEVDLTSACQALPPLPAAPRRRRPRTTTLATASGPAEVEVSPWAIAELVRVLHRPPHGDQAHSRPGP